MQHLRVQSPEPGRVMCFPGGAGAEAAAAAPEAGAGLPGSGSCCVCLSARGRGQPGREHAAVILSSRFSLRTTDVPQAQRLLRRPACWHEGPARLPQSSLQKGALAPSGLGRLQLSSPNLTPGGLTPEGCRARPRRASASPFRLTPPGPRAAHGDLEGWAES